MRNRIVASGIIVAALAATLFVTFSMQVNVVTLGAPSGAVQALVADSNSERVRGLSGRQAFPEGQGMLFVFANNQRHGIWMKDMKFAIDIVWIDQTYKVVTVRSNVHPSTYPEVFRPSRNARYVLELPAGKAASLGIAPGVVLGFPTAPITGRLKT